MRNRRSTRHNASAILDDTSLADFYDLGDFCCQLSEYLTMHRYAMVRQVSCARVGRLPYARYLLNTLARIYHQSTPLEHVLILLKLAFTARQSGAQRADGEVRNVVGAWDKALWGQVPGADADAEVLLGNSEAVRGGGEDSVEEVCA